MAQTQLPDPHFAPTPEICVVCGYSLKGLDTPGRCPECGSLFEAAQLILYGVPRKSTGTPAWRRMCWIGLCVFGVLFSQTWPILLNFDWMFLVTLLLFLLGAVVAMWVSGPRERTGVERFVVIPDGIARLPYKTTNPGERLDSVMVPWLAAETFELRRVSAVWKRLRIGSRGQGARVVEDVIFDAGIRCPDATTELVHLTISGCMRVAHERPPGGASVSKATEPPPLPAWISSAGQTPGAVQRDAASPE